MQAHAEGSTIAVPKRELQLPTPKYCESIYQSTRRPTRTVWVGKVPVGSEHPIALQTMTTTDTRDVEKTVEQVGRLFHGSGVVEVARRVV